MTDTRSLDAYEDLGYLDRPLCPHCDRELSAGPGMGALAFKCVRHGRFPAAEFEANPLDVMLRREKERRPSELQVITALLWLLPMLALARLAERLSRWVPRFFTD